MLACNLKAGMGLLFCLFSAPFPVQTGKAPQPAAKSGPPQWEDWSSPALPAKGLKPTAPVFMEKNEKPQFTRELVSVQWRPLDPIVLYIVKPKSVAKPPVALYIYGYPADTQKRFMDDSFCQRATQYGCAAVGFDTALSGERYRMRPLKEWFVSELQESLATSAHDVQLILNYLATRDDLDVTRSGVFGVGSGGSVAILAAAVDPRIKAIDLLTPWADWPAWIKGSSLVPEEERARYLTPEFLKRAAGLDPLKWLPRLKGRRLRLQLLEDDARVPRACQDSLAKAMPPDSQVERYADSMALYRATSSGRRFAWLSEQLGAVAVTSVKTGNASVAAGQEQKQSTGTGK